jgi:hypothetical protein
MTSIERETGREQSVSEVASWVEEIAGRRIGFLRPEEARALDVAPR